MFEADFGIDCFNSAA